MGDEKGAVTTVATTGRILARPGEPVLGMPPELERASEARLVAALDVSVSSILDRAPTVEERRRFVDTFWQAELAWALAQERGIASPRPDPESEATRFAEVLVESRGR